MGGPFWARKDAGAWSIPKGEYTARSRWPRRSGSSRRRWARHRPRRGDRARARCKQSGGKAVTTFAIEGDFDLAGFVSNTFEMEWPRGSGRMQEFPEVDRAAWVTVAVAREKLVKGQVPILDALAAASS